MKLVSHEWMVGCGVKTGELGIPNKIHDLVQLIICVDDGCQELTFGVDADASVNRQCRDSGPDAH